jgi:hypothetical protein
MFKRPAQVLAFTLLPMALAVAGDAKPDSTTSAVATLVAASQELQGVPFGDVILAPPANASCR